MAGSLRGLRSEKSRSSGLSKSCFNLTTDSKLYSSSDELFGRRLGHPSGSTLHQLARQGDPSRMEQYISTLSLQVPEHLEEKNLSGSTALHIAAYFGNCEAVSILQKYGANPLQKNLSGWHAGHYAGRWSQPLDMRLSVGLKPGKPSSNSQNFAFRKIRDRVSSRSEAVEARRAKLKSDSGISVFDSKESLH